MAFFTSPAGSPTRNLYETQMAEENSRSSPQLTPRSKVQRLLASLEDSEDDAPPKKVIEKSGRPPLAGITGNSKIVPPVDSNEFQDQNNEEVESGGDSPVKPRGKVAARLSNLDTGSKEFDNDSDESGNAYERIKRQLLNKAAHKPGGVALEADATEQSPGLLSDERGIHSGASEDSSLRQAERSNQTPHRRSSSPGLFLTPPSISRSPQHSPTGEGLGEHSDNSLKSPKNSRFLQLVAQKRAELDARKVEEERKRVEKYGARRAFERILSEDASANSGSSDEDVDKKLTQAARPTRKASKRAIEEMNRETQRMNRNMQLAHQAKTKKKISKDSLFARFNFRNSATSASTLNDHSSSTAATSAAASDMEEEGSKGSPPTSPAEPQNFEDIPPVTGKDGEAAGNIIQGPAYLDGDSLPDLSEFFAKQDSSGKGKETIQGFASTIAEPKNSSKQVENPPMRSIKVHLPKPLPSNIPVDLDSDSDTERLSKQKSHQKVRAKSKLDSFRQIPANKTKEANSLLKLRALAHLHSPERNARNKKVSMNPIVMQSLLQKRARQQALDERRAKIEDLKSKGIFVQTAEEREQEQIEVEDMLERARREAEELKQKEKSSKKNKFGNGDIDGLEDSSDEDDEYQNQGGDENLHLSGSENESETSNNDSNASSMEEEDQDEDAEKDHTSEKANRDPSGVLDDEASEDEDEEDDDEGYDGDDGDDELEQVPQEPTLPRRRRTKHLIIEDDEEEISYDPKVNSIITTPNAAVSKSTPAPGLPHFPAVLGKIGHEDPSLGLTQAFAATMADTQSGEIIEAENDSMELFDHPPEPDLPIFNPQDQEDVVLDTQDQFKSVSTTHEGPNTADSGYINLEFTQSQNVHNWDTQLLSNATQLSEIPDPTQDAGFALSSPAPERFADVPASTVETELLPDPPLEESPPKRRGRLHRRGMARSGSEDAPSATEKDQLTSSINAFALMKEKRKKAAAQAAFDKKKSEAKEMVEEQAQESEDEYAGLGGASDDDSAGEEDEEMLMMMFDGDVNVNERVLAALHADKERASDEKAIEKLYKDINNGGLRRKRGAELDLSDSEDDAEARRRRKQREFAKMRKALLADEKVGQIAEDPRKLAFLRAIEDREEIDDDLHFFDDAAEESFVIQSSVQDDVNSQSQEPESAIPEPSLKRKRTLQEINPNMRPPPAARRTVAVTKKPATIAEIRESVSFLVETPGAMQAPDPSSSASESEGEASNERSRKHPRRTPANPVIDRLSLKRASSTSLSSNGSTTNVSTTSARLAFYAPDSASSNSGFKVPSLLRRATTQLTSGADANGITHATERAAGGGDKEGFGAVKKGGSKKCSVNYFAREMERRSAVAGVERRQMEERERKAKERREGGLGRLIVGVGGFD